MIIIIEEVEQKKSRDWKSIWCRGPSSWRTKGLSNRYTKPAATSLHYSFPYIHTYTSIILFLQSNTYIIWFFRFWTEFCMEHEGNWIASPCSNDAYPIGFLFRLSSIVDDAVASRSDCKSSKEYAEQKFFYCMLLRVTRTKAKIVRLQGKLHTYRATYSRIYYYTGWLPLGPQFTSVFFAWKWKKSFQFTIPSFRSSRPNWDIIFHIIYVILLW